MTQSSIRRFVLVNLIAISIYALFPCAPPRLVKSLGIADTIKDRIGLSPYEEISSQINPYAAMPSMHFGYSWFFTTALIEVLQLSWSSPKAMALCAYPAAMFLVIQATGNHFLLDAVGGLIVIYVAIGLQARISAYWQKQQGADLPMYHDGSAKRCEECVE